MTRRLPETRLVVGLAAIGTVAALIAFQAIVFNARSKKLPLPSSEPPALPAEVRVKAVERNSAANVATAAFLNKTTSSAGEMWYNISL